MFSYTIYLKNYVADQYQRDTPQEGYVSENGLIWGKLAICKDPSGAVLYESEEQAEEALIELEKKFGLDREEANIIEHFVDKAFKLRLAEVESDAEDDYVAVVESNGGYFIDVMNMGIGAADDICTEVAEPLIRILAKVDQKLRELARLKKAGGA